MPELIEYYLDQGLDKDTATIYAIIEVIDNDTGNLMDELKNLGIDDIIISNDNGPDPLIDSRLMLI